MDWKVCALRWYKFLMVQVAEASNEPMKSGRGKTQFLSRVVLKSTAGFPSPSKSLCCLSALLPAFFRTHRGTTTSFSISLQCQCTHVCSGILSIGKTAVLEGNELIGPNTIGFWKLPVTRLPVSVGGHAEPGRMYVVVFNHRSLMVLAAPASIWRVKTR